MAWVPHHKHPAPPPRANPTEPTTTHREPQVLCRTPPLPRQVPHPIITPRLTLPAPSTPASRRSGAFCAPPPPAPPLPTPPQPPPPPLPHRHHTHLSPQRQQPPCPHQRRPLLHPPRPRPH